MITELVHPSADDPTVAELSSQIILDTGLNVFAATLLAESMVRTVHPQFTKLRFRHKGIVITLERPPASEAP